MYLLESLSRERGECFGYDLAELRWQILVAITQMVFAKLTGRITVWFCNPHLIELFDKIYSSE